MTKWLVTGFIAATVLILGLIWSFGMKPAPIGLIKPSPFHSSETTGQVLADRFFVDIQQLDTIVFAYRNEKNLLPIARAFIERLPTRGVKDSVVFESIELQDLDDQKTLLRAAFSKGRKLILMIPFEKEKELRTKLIELSLGKLMVWSDNVFEVSIDKAEILQSQCAEKDPNAYVINSFCRSARYSKIHLLKKKLDPSQPYFGAQRFGAFDYELYFYNP